MEAGAVLSTAIAVSDEGLLVESVDHIRTSFELMGEEIEWPWRMRMSEEDGGSASARRSLTWKPMHNYISYGALSTNRIPCAPRSGRSYYTRNCFKTREPVNPSTQEQDISLVIEYRANVGF
ncbi:hypothetical protein PTKIN_Ptkin09bG0138500 [Pterospermum kingtungense]